MAGPERTRTYNAALSQADPSLNPRLEVSNLECLRGEHRLFDRLSFELDAGTLMRIAGANGSGKTSLLRTLCGLLRPTEGLIRWNGQPIVDLGDTYNGALFYLGHQNALKDDLNAVENLRLGASIQGISLNPQAAIDALTALGLPRNVARLPVRLLSQGQKRRAALAALVFRGHAPLWLLDEAFVGLDSQAIQSVVALVEAHLAHGGIVVYTTHQDIAFAAPRHATTLHLQ